MTALSSTTLSLRLDTSDLSDVAEDDDATIDALPPQAAPRPARSLGTLAAPALLCAGDAATFALAGAALLPFGTAEGLMPRALALAGAVCIGLFCSRGLYPGYRLHGYELLRRRSIVTLRVGAVACLGALILTEGWHASLVVAAFLALALAAQILARPTLRGVLWRADLWGEPVVILGGATAVAGLHAYFTRHWQYGIRPQALDDRGRATAVALIAGAPPSRKSVASIRRRYADVILLADFPGVAISGVRPSEIGGEIGLRLGGTAGTSRPAETLARGFEIVLTATAGLLALPLLGAAALAIKCADPGPALYRQTREGLRGRPFQVLKLRTMYQDADARLEALLARDPAARATWESHFKLQRDPRVLPLVGHLLRATSIDELPQLWNVLSGDMRLVGPRPFPLYHLAAMDEPFRQRRRSVTPGLTGLWQVTGRGEADLGRQQQLDDFYLENRSFWFDMHLLLKTVPAVVRRDGAY